jgi:uncharacterized membrane protein
MKQVEWESILLENLKPLADEERFKIAEYYREMYADKLEMGASPEEILEEFGSPQECARKILQEEGRESEGVQADEKEMTPIDVAEKPVRQKKRQKWTPAMIVGMSFLTLLVILPLAGAALGVIAAFAAGCISGGASVVAGVIYSIASLFFGIFGMETGGVFANFGLGLAAIGVGFLLCVGFYYATKYTMIACYKALLWVYKRGE